MINKVTITGADSDIKHRDLMELSKEYPFVEWGILISDTRMGTDRYPTLDWINKICIGKQLMQPSMNLSLHVCGKLCKDILKGDAPDLLFKFPPLIDYFNRVQLNFNVKNSDIQLKKFMKVLSYLNNDIIFQFNQSNKDFVDFLIEFGDDKWNYLYDSSGGRGVVRSDWSKPFKKYTGYAGGLSPENLEEEIESILKVSKDTPVWIDVESGVRTENKFDLDKVKQFLEISKKYVK